MSPTPQRAQADLAVSGCPLNRDLAAAEKQANGRNVGVRALNKRFAPVTEEVATLNQIPSLTTSTLST